MLMGRSNNHNTLEHIKKLKQEETGLILRLVIGDMKRLNWVEFYGLNYTETMNLEFCDYLEMVEALAAHTKTVEQATETASSKLISSYEKGR